MHDNSTHSIFACASINPLSSFCQSKSRGRITARGGPHSTDYIISFNIKVAPRRRGRNAHQHNASRMQLWCETLDNSLLPRRQTHKSRKECNLCVCVRILRFRVEGIYSPPPLPSHCCHHIYTSASSMPQLSDYISCAYIYKRVYSEREQPHSAQPRSHNRQ